MHGADVDIVRRKYNKEDEIIDFSSNINPFLPKGIKDVVVSDFEKIRSYPDIDYIKLRKVMADYLNKEGDRDLFDFRNIAVGNGASELIYLLIASSRGRVGIFSPTFSEYRKGAKTFGKYFEEIPFDRLDEKRDKIDEDKSLDKLLCRFETIIICNPNNPDGRLRDLKFLFDYCLKKDKKLIVDETFIEFCEDFKKYSAIFYNCKNVYVIRAVTKFFGVPGIRLGYLISDKKNIEEINDIKEPWTVNCFADSIGRKIFLDKDFGDFSRSYFSIERRFIKKNIDMIDDLEIFDSDSAFFLIKIKNEISSNELKERLIKEFNILIRDAKDYFELNEKYFRIAVKTRKENERLIFALRKVFG